MPSSFQMLLLNVHGCAQSLTHVQLCDPVSLEELTRRDSLTTERLKKEIAPEVPTVSQVYRMMS